MHLFNRIVLILSVLTYHVVCIWATLPLAEVKNARGTNLIAKGQIDDAEILFEEAVKLDPENVGYLVNLGMSQKQLNKFEQAIETLNKAKKLNPNFGNIESVLDELENIFENEDLMDLTSDDDVDIDTDIEALIASLTEKAMDLVDLGDLSGSLVYFKKAYNKNKLNGNTLLNLAVTQMRLGDLIEARELFNKCKTLLPENDESLISNLKALEEQELFETESVLTGSNPGTFCLLFSCFLNFSSMVFFFPMYIYICLLL